MSLNKPLILDLVDGRAKQNPRSKDLDIPLNERFENQQQLFRQLLVFLSEQGFELPEELLNEMELYAD